MTRCIIGSQSSCESAVNTFSTTKNKQTLEKHYELVVIKELEQALFVSYCTFFFLNLYISENIYWMDERETCHFQTIKCF